MLMNLDHMIMFDVYLFLIQKIILFHFIFILNLLLYKKKIILLIITCFSFLKIHLCSLSQILIFQKHLLYSLPKLNLLMSLEILNKLILVIIFMDCILKILLFEKIKLLKFFLKEKKNLLNNLNILLDRQKRNFQIFD